MNARLPARPSVAACKMTFRRPAHQRAAAASNCWHRRKGRWNMHQLCDGADAGPPANPVWTGQDAARTASFAACLAAFNAFDRSAHKASAIMRRVTQRMTPACVPSPATCADFLRQGSDNVTALMGALRDKAPPRRPSGQELGTPVCVWRSECSFDEAVTASP